MVLLPAYELEGDRPLYTIADTAGTIVDEGSRVPVVGIYLAFQDEGIGLTERDVSQFVGIGKRAHIETVMNLPAIRGQYGRTVTGDDVERVYASYKQIMVKTAIPEHTTRIDGVREGLESMIDAGMQFWMNTAYGNLEMDATLGIPEFSWLKNLIQDNYVTNDDVAPNRGRPAPDMIYEVKHRAEILSLNKAVYIGDTEADMESADNACMPSVMILQGSTKTRAEAENINARLGRKRLILDTFAEYAQLAVSGGLGNAIREINQ